MASPALESPPPSSNRARAHSRIVSGSITATSSVGWGTPSEPGGVSGVTLMAVPPSLDPYPSTRRQSKRRSKMARSGADASVPKPWRSGLSPSSGRCRGGEDVGQRLADVGEAGGTEVTDVGEEARRAEAARQRHRRAHRQRGCPQGHDGVAVEERHRAVADVVALEPVARRGAAGDGGQAALGAAHRLGVPRGARGEEQQEEVVGPRLGPNLPVPDPPPGPPIRAGPGTRCRRRAGCARRRRRCRDRRGAAPRSSSVTTSWQSVKRMSRASSAPRRVGLIPTTVAPASSRPSEPPQVFRDVVEKDTDMERAGHGASPSRWPPAAGSRPRPGATSRWCRRSAVPAARRPAVLRGDRPRCGGPPPTRAPKPVGRRRRLRPGSAPRSGA